MYLRDKSGFGEAFAAAIFKASKNQKLPLSRFVKAFPDLIYYIVSRLSGLIPRISVTNTFVT